MGSIRENTLVKEMAAHSSVLAWEIPCTEKSDGLQSMECKRVGHDLATKQQQQHVKTIRVVCHFLLKKKKNLFINLFGYDSQSLWLWYSCFTVCGILVLRPGIKPGSPALHSEFLTSGSPGKLWCFLLYLLNLTFFSFL